MQDKSTYEYYLDTIKCPINKLINIKKQTNYTTFLRKLAGNETEHHILNKKKHTLEIAYGTSCTTPSDEKDEISEEYWIIWNIKLTKKNKITTSSTLTLSTSEDNIVS